MEATITRQWFPKGSCPKVKSYPGRKSVAYSGFVTYGSGELFVAKPAWFNYETTIASIREFMAATKLKRGEKLVLVMDNAPWHKKAKRLIEDDCAYADIRKKLTIVSLPPYSPDLNPIEQVWRVTRREKPITATGRFLKFLPPPLMIGSVLSLSRTISWLPFVRSLGENINVVYYSSAIPGCLQLEYYALYIAYGVILTKAEGRVEGSNKKTRASARIIFSGKRKLPCGQVKAKVRPAPTPMPTAVPIFCEIISHSYMESLRQSSKRSSTASISGSRRFLHSIFRISGTP